MSVLAGKNTANILNYLNNVLLITQKSLLELQACI